MLPYSKNFYNFKNRIIHLKVKSIGFKFRFLTKKRENIQRGGCGCKKNITADFLGVLTDILLGWLSPAMRRINITDPGPHKQ